MSRWNTCHAKLSNKLSSLSKRCKRPSPFFHKGCDAALVFFPPTVLTVAKEGKAKTETSSISFFSSIPRWERRRGNNKNFISSIMTISVREYVLTVFTCYCVLYLCDFVMSI